MAGKLPLAASPQALFDAKDIGEAIVPVEEWGCSVRVRGLTRGEARKIGEAGLTAEESEAFVLHRAMLEPTVTEDEAKRLVAEKSYLATEKVLDKVLELSGLNAGFR